MSIPKAVALLGIGRDHLRLIETDDDVKVVVIRGEGKDFGGGGDLLLGENARGRARAAGRDADAGVAISRL